MFLFSNSGDIEQWNTVKASEELIIAELSPLYMISTMGLNPITTLNSYFYSFGEPALSLLNLVFLGFLLLIIISCSSINVCIRIIMIEFYRFVSLGISGLALNYYNGKSH